MYLYKKPPAKGWFPSFARLKRRGATSLHNTMPRKSRQARLRDAACDNAPRPTAFPPSPVLPVGERNKG